MTGEKGFESFNTVRPEDVPQETIVNTETPTTVIPPIENSAEATNVPTQETTQPVTGVPPKVDEFIEIFNKRYGTTYKADDDVKGLFELPKKITEYEGKLRDAESAKGQVESYKKELEDLKSQGYSEFLSKPLIQKAYVAQQLLEKYPDKDPFMMQEIAMSEVDKMDDLEVVAKERKIRYPGVKLENQKAIILNELGIDPTTTPEEWDSLAKDKLTMMAGDARQRIKELTNGVEIPKLQTKEEREQLLAEALQKKVELTAPIKDKFCQFDEFVNGEFKFAVPNEYKDRLPDMFKGFFIDAGYEVNAENLGVLETLKKAMFLDEYFPKIKEVIEKQAQTIVQAQTDAELNNTETPSTQTATDQQVIEELPGVSKFLQDQQTQRVTKL